ncbi:retrotransposon protein [Cucumis melo var. makuwa]|uniref:Retrotransposon protein n=1 Tax=Cucumis melo var. makuwa TaxID=1194695 RepID=A0A5A7TXI7_CUCMM|nr:retrotransposon protein [Cucumis melo var. makuwa]
MKHSSTRNVIECTFGVLKGRWAILHGKSHYPLQVQCCIILACCLLHNLINREIINCDDIDDVDEGDSAYATTTTAKDIQYIETTNEWSRWRDKLAEAMFTECSCLHPVAKKLLNKPFYYYEKLAYVFRCDRTIGRFAESFINIRSNEPVGYERNPYAEIPELTSLDRALLQRHLLSHMDNMRGFVQMPDEERETFCRVLLRDISK